MAPGTCLRYKPLVIVGLRSFGEAGGSPRWARHQLPCRIGAGEGQEPDYWRREAEREAMQRSRERRARTRVKFLVKDAGRCKIVRMMFRT